MAVKKYRPEFGPPGHGLEFRMVMAESPTGKWTSATDYDKLAADYDKLKKSDGKLLKAGDMMAKILSSLLQSALLPQVMDPRARKSLDKWDKVAGSKK